MYGTIIRKETVYVHEGNLALRPSQQPSPLFSFGQFIIEKGIIQGFVNPLFITGSQTYYSSLIPAFVYGIEDYIALLAGLPLITKSKQGTASSSGIGDIFAQTEIFFFRKDYETYIRRMSLVCGLTLPSGSFSKNPSLGIGAPSVFLGLTAFQRGTKWYFWTSEGFTYNFPHNSTHLGTNFVYQAGIGRNVSYRADERIITFMLEFLGSYTSAKTLNGIKDKASSSNIISISPEIWISTYHVVFKAGGIIPLLQQTKGGPKKNNFTFLAVIGYTFN